MKTIFAFILSIFSFSYAAYSQVNLSWVASPYGRAVIYSPTSTSVLGDDHDDFMTSLDLEYSDSIEASYSGVGTATGTFTSTATSSSFEFTVSLSATLNPTDSSGSSYVQLNFALSISSAEDFVFSWSNPNLLGLALRKDGDPYFSKLFNELTGSYELEAGTYIFQPSGLSGFFAGQSQSASSSDSPSGSFQATFSAIPEPVTNTLFIGGATTILVAALCKRRRECPTRRCS